MIVQMVLAALASLFLLGTAEIQRPTLARCPQGWSIADGVRRSGEFACSPPLPRTCGEPVEPVIPCPSLPTIHSRVWCPEASEPVVIDHDVVGCLAKR
jgi:hypothetical protein